jgi:hypothetical protein
MKFFRLHKHPNVYVTNTNQSRSPTRPPRHSPTHPTIRLPHHPILDLTQQHPTLSSLHENSTNSWSKFETTRTSISNYKMPLSLYPLTQNGIMRWTPTTILLHALWSWQFLLSCAVLLFVISMSPQDLWGAPRHPGALAYFALPLPPPPISPNNWN